MTYYTYFIILLIYIIPKFSLVDIIFLVVLYYISLHIIRFQDLLLSNFLFAICLQSDLVNQVRPASLDVM